MNSIYNIGIAGNIGVGKTTLTERLSKDLQLEPIYESVIDNPYLLDFYTDMSRWSFNLQIYFLYTRFASQMKYSEIGKSFIQDRTIYEDAYIFAPNLQAMGLMTLRDYENYLDKYYTEVYHTDGEPNTFIMFNGQFHHAVDFKRQKERENYLTILTSML